MYVCVLAYRVGGPMCVYVYVLGGVCVWVCLRVCSCVCMWVCVNGVWLCVCMVHAIPGCFPLNNTHDWRNVHIFKWQDPKGRLIRGKLDCVSLWWVRWWCRSFYHRTFNCWVGMVTRKLTTKLPESSDSLNNSLGRFSQRIQTLSSHRNAHNILWSRNHLATCLCLSLIHWNRQRKITFTKQVFWNWS